jgi:hypothetical protein
MLEGWGIPSRAGQGKGVRGASLKLFVLASLSARLAFGQSELPAAPVAEGLFQQGKAALAAGHVAEACAKLQESQRLDPALGTLLNLALCHEREGKLASAWSELADAAAMAERSGEGDRLRFARGALAKLEGKVPVVLIRVVKRARGLELKVDGQAIGQAAWDSPLPLDAGVHHLEAVAPEKQRWARSFEVVNGVSSLTLEVPALKTMPAPQADVTTRAPARADVPSKPASRAKRLASVPVPKSDGTQRTWGYAAGALGLAGLAAGSYFGLRTIAQQDIVERHCAGASCRNQAGIDADHAAHRAATAANVSFGIGLAAVLASAYLLLTAHDDSPKIPTSHVDPPALRHAPLMRQPETQVEVSFAF